MYNYNFNYEDLVWLDIWIEVYFCRDLGQFDMWIEVFINMVIYVWIFSFNFSCLLFIKLYYLVVIYQYIRCNF